MKITTGLLATMAPNDVGKRAKELFTKRDFQGRWKYRGDL